MKLCKRRRRREAMEGGDGNGLRGSRQDHLGPEEGGRLSWRAPRERGLRPLDFEPLTSHTKWGTWSHLKLLIYGKYSFSGLKRCA